MKRHLAIYLRTHRRRWGLTQRELARLLGLKSGTQVSRLERGTRKPTFPIVVACVVIFGVQGGELFPAIMNEVEEAVMVRAYDLYLDLQGNASNAVKTKLDLLEAMLARAKAKTDEQGV